METLRRPRQEVDRVVRAFFSRQWWWTTLLVIAACGVMIRLGIWQLDRLEQRQTFNARVQAQLDQDILVLTGPALDSNLDQMEYRRVVAVGEYDHSQEVGLRNRAWGNQPGIHLVTPLRLVDSNLAVLVDRGWIPAEDADSETWSKYHEPGLVQVEGVVRRSSTRPDLGRRTDPTPLPGQAGLTLWNLLNVQRIDEQVSSPLLPVYIQRISPQGEAKLPFNKELDLDLTEGPHLGYAGQWFLFASVLAIGYPIYISRQLKASEMEFHGNGETISQDKNVRDPFEDEPSQEQQVTMIGDIK